MRKPILSTLFLLLGVTATIAQGNSCPQIVQTALDTVDDFCQEAGRNQACFGNVALTATPKEGVSEFTFEQTGDIVPVADIASMDLEPMDEASGHWGVALMRLQANIPDTMPGQNVTFLLFGDVSVEPNLDVESESPMQAFYLRTGIGDAPCAEAPASGIIVQTPEGGQEVAFNVNGVDVNMGSTILFRSMLGEEMTVSALEGSAVMNFEGDLYPVIAGTWARMGYDENGRITRPALPTAYKTEVLSALPVRLLQRIIKVREPLTPEQLEILHEKLNAGEAPCDDPDGLFPRCDKLPLFRQIREQIRDFRWASGERWSDALPRRFNINGELLDLLDENGVKILEHDDGRQCILGDALPEGDERPLCKDVLPERAYNRISNALGLTGGAVAPVINMVESVVDGVVTLSDGRVCAMGARNATETILPCKDVLTVEEIQALRPNNNNNAVPPLDDRLCVYPPGPNDPPLPATETRPFCQEIVPGQNLMPNMEQPVVPPDLPPSGGGDDEGDDNDGDG